MPDVWQRGQDKSACSSSAFGSGSEVCVVKKVLYHIIIAALNGTNGLITQKRKKIVGNCTEDMRWQLFTRRDDTFFYSLSCMFLSKSCMS